MALLDIHSSHLIYGDTQVVTANPKRVYVDWSRHHNSVQVERPESKSFVVEPGQSLSLFSGSRSTAIDGTTAFALTLNPALASVYRLTATGGAAPAFRTARSFSPSGVALTLTVNNNATLELSMGSGTFNAQVGDTVLLPGTTTGDSASPFSPLNVGLWIVVGATTTKLTLVRPVGTDFQGVGEVVTPSTNAQLLIYSAAGVQVGDKVEISAGFSSVTQQAFLVSAVTPSWIEFTSTQALPLETGITPGAAGMTFYTSVKRFVRVEVDQEAVLRFNGDTGNTNRLAPRVAGDADQMAHLEKWGPTWQLVVVNRSTTASMVVNTISAE
jgi:hypothetical protein